MADPPVPAALGIYGAALTVALAARDPDERAGGRRLIAQIGQEILQPIRTARTGRAPRPPCHTLAELIRETLTERLADD